MGPLSTGCVRKGRCPATRRARGLTGIEMASMGSRIPSQFDFSSGGTLRLRDRISSRFDPHLIAHLDTLSEVLNDQAIVRHGPRHGSVCQPCVSAPSQAGTYVNTVTAVNTSGKAASDFEAIFTGTGRDGQRYHGAVQLGHRYDDQAPAHCRRTQRDGDLFRHAAPQPQRRPRVTSSRLSSRTSRSAARCGRSRAVPRSLQPM